MGLLEPINTRITDPRYFLDTPQQGRPPTPGRLLSIDSPALLESHDPSPWFLSQRQPSYRRWEDPTSSCRW